VATVRRNQARLKKEDWDRYVSAIDAVRKSGAKKPNYKDFVDVHLKASSHAGMDWGVHTMSMDGMAMKGHNFLAWHRQYLVRFERRLQEEDPDVFLPYWNWITDPKIPPQINRKAQLQRWGINRQWDPSEMPDRRDVTNATRHDPFRPFQSRLERGPHNAVHGAVGGAMATYGSPRDPLFWLHHANVDRIWAQWQSRSGKRPPDNRNEKLQPPPLFGVRVSDVLKVSDLDYRYA
jgi:tyrosinase